jgi:tetratricopeptide (TPR) repeat protein
MKTNDQWEELFNFLTDKDWHGATKTINDIIDSDRENPNLYLKKGDICLKAGDRPEAVNAYLKAAWYLNKDGFFKKALAIYKLVLRYDPDNDEALHESNRIMMELESATAKGKKAEWMIFPPEETPLSHGPKAKQPSTPNSPKGQAGTSVTESGTVVPSGLLSYFTDGEVKEILGSTSMKKFSDGEPVVREGDSGDSVYIISKGFSSVVSHFSGRMLLLDTLAEGDLFGEMAFLTGRTRTASVIAKGDLEVYEIERPLLEYLVGRRPEILSQLSSIYVKRVRDTLKKVRSQR